MSTTAERAAVAASALIVTSLVTAGCATTGDDATPAATGSQQAQAPRAPVAGEPSRDGSGTGPAQALRAQMRAQARPAPTWMVGQFVGTGAGGRLTDIALTVTADGRLSGSVGKVSAEGQYVGNGRVLWAHGNESLVERRGAGFRLVQTKNPANVTDYVRRPAP